MSTDKCRKCHGTDFEKWDSCDTEEYTLIVCRECGMPIAKKKSELDLKYTIQSNLDE